MLCALSTRKDSCALMALFFYFWLPTLYQVVPTIALPLVSKQAHFMWGRALLLKLLEDAARKKPQRKPDMLQLSLLDFDENHQQDVFS